MLNHLGAASRLKPNLLKSSMFIAGVVSNEDATVLSRIMGMEIKQLPVNYLGLPLISSRLKASDCESIKQKLVARNTSWTSRALGYAGRVQLAISALQGIHAYWTSIFVVPRRF